jgi:hypothetical protein
VLVSFEELRTPRETTAILSDAAAVADIRERKRTSPLAA